MESKDSLHNYLQSIPVENPSKKYKIKGYIDARIECIPGVYLYSRESDRKMMAIKVV